MNYESLHLRSGGVNGYAILSSIYVLNKMECLNNINKYIGESVGSIISTLLILKYNSLDIFKVLISNDIEDIYLNNDFQKNNIILNLLNNYGLSDSKSVERLIILFFKERGLKPNITFKELYKFNPIELNIIASNITKNRLEIFSSKTTPDISVIFAIKASCTIPLIFKPMYYKNNILIDGGFFSNFKNPLINNKTLTIKLEIKNKNNVNNLVDYIKLLINSITINNTLNRLNTINIKLKNIGVNFNLNRKLKKDIFNYGILHTYNFIKFRNLIYKIFINWKKLVIFS